MKSRNAIEKNSLFATVIPIGFALVFRALFDFEGWGFIRIVLTVMTVTFLISLPFLVGALSILLSPAHRIHTWRYRIFFPWIPVFGFFVLTLALSIEGWICWIMVLPIFLFCSSVGGIIAAIAKGKFSARQNNINISIAILLPFLLAPIENEISKIPSVYRATTSIDIEATAVKIWPFVTRVKEIKETDDHAKWSRWMGFPRPLHAELNFEGVGAERKAVFDKGLVFDEKVTEYDHQKVMAFTIAANPYEIPSTTMDEHILIGGKHFDVLDGRYELEKLSDSKFRLHLESRFQLNTTFNFYSGWWANLIMSDIQNNILEVIKNRAENQ